MLLIGNKIKNLRKLHKIRQADLCNDMLNRTVLSKIETDKMLPSIPQLQYIALKLGVPISYFFDDSFNSPAIMPINDICQNHSNVDTLYKQGLYYDIIKLYEEGIIKKKSVVDDTFYIGMSYFHLNMPNEALRYLRRYINRYNRYDVILKELHIQNFTNALNTLCKVMIKNQNYTKALHYLFIANENLYKYEKNVTQIHFAINSNIGSIYCIQNQYSKAISVLKGFLSKHKDCFYTKIIADIHLCLNISYYNLGNYEKAIYHIKCAIFLYFYLGNDSDAIESHLNYINALRYSNKVDEALRILEEYKLQYEPLCDKALSIRFKIQEMILYFNKKEYNQVVERSNGIKVRELSPLSKTSYYFMLGHINFEMNNYPKAHEFLIKCEKLFEQNNFNHDLSILYSDLHRITEDDYYKERIDSCMKDGGKLNISLPINKAV